MKETYYLNTDTLPTIPTPHDCVIKEILFDSEFVVLKFEDDISYHDSIKSIMPNALSLEICIHLVDPLFDTYKYTLGNSLFRKEGYTLINNSKLQNASKRKFEYLYHNIGYQSIMIKLFRYESYLLDINADYIEFDWIEK